MSESTAGTIETEERDPKEQRSTTVKQESQKPKVRVWVKAVAVLGTLAAAFTAYEAPDSRMNLFGDLPHRPSNEQINKARESFRLAQNELYTRVDAQTKYEMTYIMPLTTDISDEGKGIIKI